MVKEQMSRLGISGAGPTMFRESIEKIIASSNSHDKLIQTSNKEIQHQTLEMVSKLSKDLF